MADVDQEKQSGAPAKLQIFSGSPEPQSQEHGGQTVKKYGRQVKPSRIVPKNHEHEPFDQLCDWPTRPQLLLFNRCEEIPEVFTEGDVIAKCLYVMGIKQMITQTAEIEPRTGDDGKNKSRPPQDAGRHFNEAETGTVVVMARMAYSRS